MGRRSKGEGSIVKRSDGRWQGAYQDSDKRRYVDGKTRKEVTSKLREALWGVHTGSSNGHNNQTLETHFIEWLGAIENSIRLSTFNRYKQIVHIHLIPELGKIKLKNLSPTQIQNLYLKKIKALSPRTVQYIHTTLRLSLSYDVRFNLTNSNVADSVNPPRLIKKEITPLGPEEVNRLFETIDGHPLEALFVLAVTTGWRRGEILGLQWKDIDLDKGTLQVQRSLSLIKGGPLSILLRPTKVREMWVCLTSVSKPSSNMNYSKRVNGWLRTTGWYSLIKRVSRVEVEIHSTTPLN